MVKWGNEPVGSLEKVLATTMPAGAPHSLAADLHRNHGARFARQWRARHAELGHDNATAIGRAVRGDTWDLEQARKEAAAGPAQFVGLVSGGLDCETRQSVPPVSPTTR